MMGRGSWVKHLSRIKGYSNLTSWVGTLLRGIGDKCQPTSAGLTAACAKMMREPG